jgi:hydrogenase large subunit
MNEAECLAQTSSNRRRRVGHGRHRAVDARPSHGRAALSSSYYEDWVNEKPFVTRDPLGNPVDIRHPWNQTTLPAPQKRDLQGRYSWVMSPRWLDRRTGDHLALDTGGGPFARLYVTALANLVDTPYVKSTGSSVSISLPRSERLPEMTLEWKIPQWSNAIERNRARVYFVAYSAAMALHFLEVAMDMIRGGDMKVFNDFEVPDEAIGCGFHEAVRGVLSHHLVIRTGRSPTPTRRRRGTAARRTPTAPPVPTRTRCRTCPSSRRTAPTTSRASTSCARCAASIPACPAGCTCTSAAAAC